MKGANYFSIQNNYVEIQIEAGKYEIQFILCTAFLTLG